MKSFQGSSRPANFLAALLRLLRKPWCAASKDASSSIAGFMFGASGGADLAACFASGCFDAAPPHWRTQAAPAARHSIARGAALRVLARGPSRRGLVRLHRLKRMTTVQRLSGACVCSLGIIMRSLVRACHRDGFTSLLSTAVHRTRCAFLRDGREGADYDGPLYQLLSRWPDVQELLGQDS